MFIYKMENIACILYVIYFPDRRAIRESDGRGVGGKAREGEGEEERELLEEEEEEEEEDEEEEWNGCWSFPNGSTTFYLLVPLYLTKQMSRL